MRVFITGSGGHIGQAVVSELVGAGHEVLGLVRSDSSAAAVEALGAQVVRGDVNDLDLLRATAAEVDGVLHLAYDNASVAAGDMQTAADADMAIVRAIGDALAGTGKAFVGIGAGRTGDPERDRAMEANPRTFVGRELIDLADRGVRAVLVGVPPVTHSDRDHHGFIPIIIGIAKRNGAAGYIGDGSTQWAAAHTLDIAALFRLALEEAPAGAQLAGGAESGVPTRDIAEAIAGHLGVPATSVSPEDAPAFFAPFIFMGFDMRMPSTAARDLGWTPTHATLVEDIDAGHYFA